MSEAAAKQNTAAKPIRVDAPRGELSGGHAGGGRDAVLALHRSAGNRAVSSLLGSRRGRALDDSIREEMETAFDEDFTDVRLHTGEEAARAAKALNAKAFTIGAEVFFDEGRYAPSTGSGRRLLAHELAHVVQQTRGFAPRNSAAETPSLEAFAREAAVRSMSAQPVPAPVQGAAAPGIAREPNDPDPLQFPEQGIEMPWVGKGPGIDSSELGFLRDSEKFWKAYAEAHPQTLSPDNLALAKAGKAPSVDPHWVAHNPQHAGYEGDPLVHHHVGKGSKAVGIPKRVHEQHYSKVHPSETPVPATGKVTPASELSAVPQSELRPVDPATGEWKNPNRPTDASKVEPTPEAAAARQRTEAMKPNRRRIRPKDSEIEEPNIVEAATPQGPSTRPPDPVRQKRNARRRARERAKRQAAKQAAKNPPAEPVQKAAAADKAPVTETASTPPAEAHVTDPAAKPVETVAKPTASTQSVPAQETVPPQAAHAPEHVSTTPAASGSPVPAADAASPAPAQLAPAPAATTHTAPAAQTTEAAGTPVSSAPKPAETMAPAGAPVQPAPKAQAPVETPKAQTAAPHVPEKAPTVRPKGPSGGSTAAELEEMAEGAAKLGRLAKFGKVARTGGKVLGAAGAVYGTYKEAKEGIEHGQSKGEAISGALGSTVGSFSASTGAVIANVANMGVQAIGDHLIEKAEKEHPNDPAKVQEIKQKVEIVKGTSQTAVEVLPSSTITQGVKAFGRSAWNLSHGDMKAMDKQAEGFERGEAGGPLMGLAMATDLAGSIAGGEDPNHALNRVAKMGEGTALAKAGDYLGDQTYQFVNKDLPEAAEFAKKDLHDLKEKAKDNIAKAWKWVTE